VASPVRVCQGYFVRDIFASRSSDSVVAIATPLGGSGLKVIRWGYPGVSSPEEVRDFDQIPFRPARILTNGRFCALSSLPEANYFRPTRFKGQPVDLNIKPEFGSRFTVCHPAVVRWRVAYFVNEAATISLVTTTDMHTAITSIAVSSRGGHEVLPEFQEFSAPISLLKPGVFILRYESLGGTVASSDPFTVEPLGTTDAQFDSQPLGDSKFDEARGCFLVERRQRAVSMLYLRKGIDLDRWARYECVRVYVRDAGDSESPLKWREEYATMEPPSEGPAEEKRELAGEMVEVCRWEVSYHVSSELEEGDEVQLRLVVADQEVVSSPIFRVLPQNYWVHLERRQRELDQERAVAQVPKAIVREVPDAISGASSVLYDEDALKREGVPADFLALLPGVLVQMKITDKAQLAQVKAIDLVRHNLKLGPSLRFVRAVRDSE
jgi:hypothetical protein